MGAQPARPGASPRRRLRSRLRCASARSAPRPRAVYLLGGDVHAGGAHVCDPRRASRAQPTIVQLTSSPIANTVVDSRLWDLVEHLQEGTSWARVLLTWPRTEVQRSTNKKARFDLDTELGRHYECVNVDFLPERNYGTFQVRRTAPGRTFEVIAEIKGEHRRITQMLEYDLDAPGAVEVTDLAGKVMSAEGTITMYRTVALDTGYGQDSDYLDVEAVITLAGWDGWAFGVPLRSGRPTAILSGAMPPHSAASAMAELCQQAVLHNTKVSIDFDRTGPKLGIVRRLDLQPHT